jgi:hypothetical protein
MEIQNESRKKRDCLRKKLEDKQRRFFLPNSNEDEGIPSEEDQL